ncbi:hypothetical protein Tsubulata_027195 [Turnera subulata]|uniref:GRF-type domain-containing protein n=1 Tax=Turnera subulata TaxID=218843 RepID=A0A9Q0FNR3_9ROSI|nr:hypothetical protein Tsubulata_027195 [Turnera subulata]
MASQWSPNSQGSSGSSATKGVAITSRKRITAYGRQRPNYSYEGPAIMCHCGKKSPQWTSWTNEHPGMRFHRCGRRHCGFFVWADEPIVGRAREVIRDLRDNETELCIENERLQRENVNLSMEVQELKMQVRDLKQKLIDVPTAERKNGFMNFFTNAHVLVVEMASNFDESLIMALQLLGVEGVEVMNFGIGRLRINDK